MPSFGHLLRLYRRQCQDPQRGGLLTQERLGELLGSELGDAGYTGAAVSDWERDKSKIHADNRPVLVALITLLHRHGGMATPAEADDFLAAGNYRALNDSELSGIFTDQSTVLGVENDVTNVSRGFQRVDSPKNVPGSRARIDPRRRQRQQVLLGKVRRFWVEGVLDKALDEGGLIRLAQQRTDEVIKRPWDDVLGAAVYEKAEVRGAHTAIGTFLDGDGSLLILGEPGSGKTTTLIVIAKELIARAEQDDEQPIPVILNLASWTEQKQSLADWVVEELTAKYLIPRQIGREWLENDHLLLLLDSFDEIPERFRPQCANVINQFRELHGLTGLVVCSRIEEYATAGVALKLSGAITLLPLTPAQIDDYLAAAGPRLQPLRAAVRRDETLLEMARSPLMLSIMNLAYSDNFDRLDGMEAKPPVGSSSQLTTRRQHLFATYVGRVFRRRPLEERYPPDQAMRWLAWLARQMFHHNRPLLLIERIQPNWLPNRNWRWVYLVATGLTVGFVGGLIMWLLLQLLRQTTPQLSTPLSDQVATYLQITEGRAESVILIVVNLVLGVLVALIQGNYFEGLQAHRNETDSSPLWPYRRHMLSVGLAVFLVTFVLASVYGEPLFALAWGILEAVIYLTVARYVYGRSYDSEIKTVEALGWSWPKAAKGLLFGLILAAIFEIMGWLLIDSFNVSVTFLIPGVAVAVIGGMRGRRVETKVFANQGIHLSIRNSFIAATLSALVVAAFSWYLRWPAYAFLAGLLVFVIAGALFGGGNVFKHILVRSLLWLHGDMPLNYAGFLDHAAGLILLRKVGGGYIYIHRLLQQYFASLDDSTPEVNGLQLSRPIELLRAKPRGR